MKIIHLFQWRLKDIIKELPMIKRQGFNAIQITPIQLNKFGGELPWWGFYQPVGFSIGNQTGSKEELIELCNKANELGIRIICDIVLNHVASKDTGEVLPHEKVDIELTNNPYIWKDSRRIENWDSRYENINFTIGLPSLDLSNYTLQDKIIDFLNELIDCGVSGFRVDAAKHMKLPCEGSDFFSRVFSSLKSNNLFNYAEVIFADNALIDEYSKYMNVLTNCSGSDKDKLVVFPFSHDSDFEFKYTLNMTSDMCIEEYKILRCNFKHVLFYVRPFDNTWKDPRIMDINSI